MSRRIEIELTSNKGDGTWTWRAAGAKQPKGTVTEAQLYDDASTGDVCKVEADFLLDGIEILEVFPPKAKKARADILEMKPRELREDELVTTTRVARNERGGGDRKGGGRRNERGDRKGGRDGGRDGGRGRGDTDRRPRGPEPEPKPKPKRLRPKRVHRDEVLAAVPEEHRPIAEQVMKGGMQAVRAAIETQNKEAKEAGTPEIAVKPVVAIAEDLVPKLRGAEWHDRADAALADIAELDLRDLRSVVVAADAARGEEAKALAESLRVGLNARIESDHEAWLDELREAITSGRSVRALRMSSRPVKAGAPLPSDLAAKLTEMAVAGLTADTGQDRWATVVDAVAFSPVRNTVTPGGIPVEPKEELLEAVRRVADRVPTIAALFGIDPSEAAKAKRRRPQRKKKTDGKGGSKGGDGKGGENKAPKKPKQDRPVPGAEPTPEPAAEEAPATEAPAAEEPAAVATEAPAAEASATEEAAPATEEAAPVEEAPATEEAAPVEEAPATEEAAPVEEAPATEES